ncbi:MAG: hypothetical protein ACR2KY_01945 [Thermoleophilaceae bacterium]
MASVADKIHTILEAAEATAAAIRHEAEADADRAARERRRRDDARDELSHLSRLADALSVQAEAVSRQCDIVARVLLPPEADADAAVEPVERGSQPVEPRPAAGPERAAGHEPAGQADPAERTSPVPPSPLPSSPEGGIAPGEPSASASASTSATTTDPPAPSPEVQADASPARSSVSDTNARGDGSSADGGRLPSPWIEAYRMRLAGAQPDEVEAHLRRNGVDDPSKVVAEVFRDERSDHP